MDKVTTMKESTTLIQAGRDPKKHQGMVNTPVYQTSTILFETLSQYEAASAQKVGDPSYGIAGTVTHRSLSEALATWEGAENCLLTPSGLSAITLTLFTLLSHGDHVLLVDTIYGPTRRFALKKLKRLGIEATFYDPLIGKDIAKLIQKNTKLIFLEAPGSLTFEMQDVPAIVSVAKKHGVLTAFDNSWATPLYYKPLAHGIDISIQALTKYAGGHSDVIMGSVATNNKDVWKRLMDANKHFGLYVSAEQASLAARGLRTIEARMKQHFSNAMVVAKFLQKHKKVSTIIYPPLVGDAGYKIWKRDFNGGGAALFTILLDKKYSEKSIHAFVDGMKLFGIGASWGGYESLILRINPETVRTATKWAHAQTAIRLHIGLENSADLITDLEAGFKRL